MSDYTLLAAVLSLRALSAPLPAHRPSCRPTSPPPARPPLRRRAASFPLLVTPSDVTSHRPAACAVHRARRSRPRPHPRPACTRAGPTVLALAPPTPGRAALACRAALLRPAWAPALVRLRCPVPSPLFRFVALLPTVFLALATPCARSVQCGGRLREGWPPQGALAGAHTSRGHDVRCAWRYWLRPSFRWRALPRSCRA